MKRGVLIPRLYTDSIPLARLFHAENANIFTKTWENGSQNVENHG
jgi:hypothetical protein